MSEATRSSSGLTRRGFLKAAGATAGAFGLAGAAGMLATDGWLSPAIADGGAGEYTACTYHQGHCGGMCPLKCTVRDGRLVMVQPNDASIDERYRTICLKGISEVQHIYGTGRVQAPLKRTGARGSNEFTQVSWDEALDDIASQITSIQAESGKGAVMVTTSSEMGSSFLGAVLGARGLGNTGIDVGMGNGLDPAIGYGAGYATSTSEPRDWVHSKLVLTVGSNFCESTLPQVRLFFEAKEAGAKMVTVDPHFSTTASKSDEWVPIEPGTDAALFLGMASVILEEGLADEAFMQEHTSLPFLVNTATGMLVRDHEPVMVMGADGKEAPETGEQNPFFVIDPATGQAAAYATVAAPALSGTVGVEGGIARTVYDLLLESQKEYTVDWAAGVTGIAADKIRELARLYAAGPSSLALGWGGNDKMTNADIAGHAAALIVALTGNVGKPGAGVGVYVGGTWSGIAATLGAWTLPAELAESTADIASYDLRTKENNVRAVICCGDAFAQKFANMGLTEEWVKKLDLVVTIDPYFTEGAKWCDYVLPATTRFEFDADFGNVKSGYNQIVLQQKVIDPLFEAKTDLWIEREFARRMGVADTALPKDGVELCETILSTSTDPYVSKITLDELAAAGGVWPLENSAEPRRNFTDYAFLTTSGRMDVYYDNLVAFDQALPKWEACTEIGDAAQRARYPLQLANVRSRFHIHNQFNDAEWIQQYFEPTVELNPTELASRGIETGDVVEVANDRGSFKVRVAGNEAIRPGVARLVEAATADYIEAGNLQSVTNDTMIERGYELLCGPVAPFSDTLVDVRKA